MLTEKQIIDVVCRHISHVEEDKTKNNFYMMGFARSIESLVNQEKDKANEMRIKLFADACDRIAELEDRLEKAQADRSRYYQQLVNQSQISDYKSGRLSGLRDAATECLRSSEGREPEFGGTALRKCAESIRALQSIPAEKGGK